jgi:hypothetical protein
MSEVFQREFTKPDGTKIMALGNFIQVYMDDLLIYSKTAEEHLAHLEFIFEALYEHGFYLNPKKCEFNKPEVRFLGHIISQEGCKVDPCKVETMNEWREPTTGKEMYSFLGFANYFRQFIRDYATIAAPLHELVHMKKFGDKWTDLHRACFEAIKLALANAPTLKMPDFQSPFEVIVDASNVAIGAVLVQQDRPVAYESKKLTDTQKRWTTTERELWAAVHALKLGGVTCNTPRLNSISGQITIQTPSSPRATPHSRLDKQDGQSSSPITISNGGTRKEKTT